MVRIHQGASVTPRDLGISGVPFLLHAGICAHLALTRDGTNSVRAERSGSYSAAEMGSTPSWCLPQGLVGKEHARKGFFLSAPVLEGSWGSIDWVEVYGQK